MTDTPRPLASLLASARRLTSRTSRSQTARPGSLAEEAWAMFDQVGELHFLVATLAARMAQARLFVGELPDDPSEEPDPVDDPALTSILDAVGGGPLGRTPLVYRLGVNLFVPGEAWVAGIPSYLLPEGQLPSGSLTVPVDEAPLLVGEGFDIGDIEWRTLSAAEVMSTAAREVTLILGETPQDRLTCSRDQVLLFRVWQPHPRKAWEADSPTLAILPVLRKIVGLDQRDMAQIKSRLAGAGMLVAPQSAQRAIRSTLGIAEGDDQDPFTEALIEAMMTPVADQSSASALVPLVATVPDEATGLFNYIDFAKPLDSASPGMLDQAIRRMALGMNAPPELLLGTSSMNHWGAFLVQEDTVATHLEPPLALVCDAFTREYLWPVLLDQGMDETTAHRYVIWYDTSDLVIRPNHSTDALELHARGVIGDEAVRAATAFDESDAPFPDDELPREVAMALELAAKSPALVADPGLPQLAAQIKAVLEGDIPEVATAPVAPPPGAPGATQVDGQQQPVPVAPDGSGVPQTQGEPPTQPPPGNPQPQAASASTNGGW